MPTTGRIALDELTVADIMQRHIVTLEPDMPLAEAARILWDEQVGGAPVVDAQHRVVGLLSTTDIARAKAFGVRHNAVVRDVMTAAAITVRSAATLTELARFFTRTGLHRALVMERGELLGIISTMDVMAVLAGPEPELVETGELPGTRGEIEC